MLRVHRAEQLCGRFAEMDKTWPHPEGHTGERVSYKAGRAQTLRVVMMELYRASQLQRGGCYYFYSRDQGDSAEEVILRTLPAGNDFWAQAMEGIGQNIREEITTTIIAAILATDGMPGMDYLI